MLLHNLGTVLVP